MKMALSISFSIFAFISVGLTGLVDSTQAFGCDFEDDMCGYTSDLSADFNWTHSNATPSDFTGPSSDHTHGNGRFVYLETSKPRLNGDKARLQSPQIDSASDDNCLEFYYHMYGSHINTLHVYLSTDESIPIWSLKKEQGDSWRKAQVPLNLPLNMFQIIFEGIVGPSYRGDIAIDDISTTYKASCTIQPTAADPAQKVTPSVPQATLPWQPFCGRTLPSLSRIVGGSNSSEGEWPWQAMLMYQREDGSWKQYCGGTLIYPTWVLTAAHCIVDDLPDAKTRVRMGAYYTNTSQTTGYEQDFDVIQITYHPDYNSIASYNKDLALLRLDRPVVRNSKVNYACLPNSGNHFSPGSMCTLTGWGHLESEGEKPVNMMHVKVPIVSPGACTANGSYAVSEITPNMLCAGYVEGGKDTCQGDSGGPLSCTDEWRWYIFGVTSWGYGCAAPNYYGVYARVGSLLNWIANVVTSVVA